MGDLGTLSGAGTPGTHDVRPDDGGLLDLHRLAGHRAGHLRDTRLRCPPAFWRNARRSIRAYSRAGRDGRGTTPGRYEARIDKRLATWYLDRKTSSLDEAMDIIASAVRGGETISVGLLGNAAEVLPEMVARGLTPDVLTDQTSAHDMLEGYVPAGMSLDDAAHLRRKDPDEYIRRSTASVVDHVGAMLEMQA